MPYTPTTTYNNSTGNLASKAGVSYTYGTSHPHAVTHLNGVQKYWYDANGNQTRRITSNGTYDLTYDGENRLTKVMNGSTTIATFVYDGDGQRVKSTLNGVTTTFVGNYYEKTGTNITKYYYAGTARVAMRNTSVKYLFGDQLGSTSVTTSSSGVIGSQERYKPFGEKYYTSGTLPTRYTFTGQYSYTINTNEIGLLYYGARFYDPVLGRFASADTIIPGAGNPQSWDRYSYVRNNPVNRVDPTGHADQDIGGGCQNDHKCRQEFLERRAVEVLRGLGGKDDLEAMAQIIEVGASLYDTYSDLLPALNKTFMGFDDASLFTLMKAAFGGYGGCAGIGRGTGDCPSNQYSFADKGFHQDYWDRGNNQIFHVWPYIANVGNLYSLGGIGLAIAQFGNYYHEVIESWRKNGNAPGSSWEDYFLAQAGMEIGVYITNGEVPMADFADFVRWRLGPNGPGSNGLIDVYYQENGPLNVSPITP